MCASEHACGCVCGGEGSAREGRGLEGAARRACESKGKSSSSIASQNVPLYRMLRIKSSPDVVTFVSIAVYSSALLKSNCSMYQPALGLKVGRPSGPIGKTEPGCGQQHASSQTDAESKRVLRSK